MGNLLKGHVEVQHEFVIYNCDQCSYKGKTKGHVKQLVATQHKGVSITATNVVTI